jgi:hypothetical protein
LGFEKHGQTALGDITQQPPEETDLGIEGETTKAAKEIGVIRKLEEFVAFERFGYESETMQRREVIFTFRKRTKHPGEHVCRLSQIVVELTILDNKRKEVEK